MNNRLYADDVTYSITVAWFLITVTLKVYGVIDWPWGVCWIPFGIAAINSIIYSVLRERRNKRG